MAANRGGGDRCIDMAPVWAGTSFVATSLSANPVHPNVVVVVVIVVVVQCQGIGSTEGNGEGGRLCAALTGSVTLCAYAIGTGGRIFSSSVIIIKGMKGMIGVVGNTVPVAL